MESGLGDMKKVQLSELLRESKILNDIAKSLGLFSGTDQKMVKAAAKNQRLKSSPEKEAKKAIKKILDEIGADVKKTERHVSQTDENVMLRYFIELDKKDYVLKVYIIAMTGHMSAVLWKENEMDIVGVVTAGYTRNYHQLTVIGVHSIKVLTGV